jgi:hypothetical protein
MSPRVVHDGSHANCRQCGTNPRSLGTNPRGPRPLSDPEQRRAAFEREVDENRKRHMRSDLDAAARRRSVERIRSIRASLKADAGDAEVYEFPGGQQ